MPELLERRQHGHLMPQHVFPFRYKFSALRLIFEYLHGGQRNALKFTLCPKSVEDKIAALHCALMPVEMNHIIKIPRP